MAAALELAIDEHPLLLQDFSNESTNLSCSLCKRNISAEAYTCIEGCPSYYHRECLNVPTQIDQHPLHPDHPLHLGYRRAMFRCDACREDFSAGSCSFRCDKCEFDLDIGCALITSLWNRGGSQDTTLERMNLQHHPHRLTWFSTKHVFIPGHNCTICLEDVEGDGYMCLDRWCKFLIHKTCSQDLFGVDGSNDMLQHPGHIHPLVPHDSRLNPFKRLNAFKQGCGLCHQEISAEAYTCQGECNFYIHRACAEAPLKIYRHPLHPDHPLALSHCQPAFRCYACGEILCVGSSSFKCDECGFDLDIGCALSTQSYQGGSNKETTLEQIALSLHPHSLTSFSWRRGFIGGRCNLCHDDVKGDGYMCMHHGCRFIIHKKCIRDLSYADGIKAPLIYHCHPLETFVGEDPCLRICANCRSNTAGEFICCEWCKFFIHRDCIGMPEILQYPTHPDHSLVLFVTYPYGRSLQCESCSGPLEVELCYHCNFCDIFVHIDCALQTLAYSEEGMSARIDWAWHQHPLFLCHKTKLCLNYCCYCGDKSLGPTYECNSNCGFVLHERCIKIEPKMIHPHHPDHLLTLWRKADPPPFCEACCRTIDGLVFFCKHCSFYLHAQCAARVPTQKHYLHEHELQHFDEVPSLECNRCGTSTDSPLFRCVPCNFNLHEKCMELPRVVKHDTHVHPLTLQATYVEDDSGEYYCDLCEKRRDGRLGVYVCGQCSARWAFHIECVVPELRKVFTRKGQSSAVKALDEKITSIDEEVRNTEEKLKEMKRELDELKKQRAQIISREEKNYVAMTGEGEPGNPF